MNGSAPALRVIPCNEEPVNTDGDFVLYWMTAFRRVSWNFSLDRAVDWARELHKPLLILEALRCDYPWASDRLHAFVLEGMAHNARELTKRLPLCGANPGRWQGAPGKPLPKCLRHRHGPLSLFFHSRHDRGRRRKGGRAHGKGGWQWPDPSRPL